MTETPNTLERRVLDLLSANLSHAPEAIPLEMELDQLVEDSIELFGIITIFEKEFKLEAKYEDLVEMETVQDIISYLKKQGVAG